MRIYADVEPGRMISELLDYFESNPDFDHRYLTFTDIINLGRIREIIISKKKEAGYDFQVEEKKL
jgi:hypothetical protein